MHRALVSCVVLSVVATGCGGNELLLTAEAPAAHTQLVFEDTFSTQQLDTERWDTTWWVGPIFHTDHAWFSDDALAIQDGVLAITASETRSANPADPFDVRRFTTGQISTNRTFDHGTFEIRARHQAGANLVQALWLLPYPYQWPPEIDIVETRLSVDPETVFLNVHSGTEARPIDQPTYVDLESELDGTWRTYRLVWDGPTVAWYVDGELVRSQETPVSGVPMRLIIDQSWIVPWSGGAPIAAELPVTFEIDYVRVWQ